MPLEIFHFTALLSKTKIEKWHSSLNATVVLHTFYRAWSLKATSHSCRKRISKPNMCGNRMKIIENQIKDSKTFSLTAFFFLPLSCLRC